MARWHGHILGKNFLLNTVIERKIEENMGTAVAQWLRCCATNRKVASSQLVAMDFSLT
jgi:hypothetical protein